MSRAALAAAGLLLAASAAAAQTRTPASGTAWDPGAASHAGLHAAASGWMLQLHAMATLYRADEGGTRGDEQWGSRNWFMGSAERPLGRGTLRFRGMLSLEPVTVGGCGMPNLLQSGEICDGQPIVDAQHPHDLFSELSAYYARDLGRGIAGDVYLAAVGEPALGPAAFPHRASARENPVSPITHHWLDATHIAFGVATLGVEGRFWRAEGSIFNGREPDDERMDFDYAPLESYAARIQLAPAKRFVLQVSRARMRNAHRHVILLPPELECPPGLAPADGSCHIVDEGDTWLDVTRTTASISWYSAPNEGLGWSITAASGWNQEQGHLSTDGALLEGTMELAGGTVFGRAERVEKTDHDLGIRPSLQEFLSGGLRSFHLTKLVVGYARDVARGGGLTASLGGALSWSRIPADLEDRYGDRWPMGAVAFLTLTPGQ